MFGTIESLKVLVVKLSAFGDIIHALPALDDLLKQPEVTEVHWLLDRRFAFVADIFPPQVKVHKVALKGESKIRHAWHMIQTLRQENFDIIFDLQGLLKSGVMAWASAQSSCKVYGFDREQSPEWPNFWFVNPVAFHPNEKHVVPLYRHIIAAAFNIQQITRVNAANKAQDYVAPHIQVTLEMQKKAQQVLLDMGLPMPFSILHVGGSYSTKRLPDAQWQQLVKLMQCEQKLLVLWGNEEEKSRATDIAKGYENIIVAPHCFSLPVLAGLLQQASAYLGQDTGVSHLAAACDCPTIILWGATAPWRMGALGSIHRHIIPISDCAPCFKRQCDHFICMPSLNVQYMKQAWQAVRR
ncbi:MAG: glycosyltransferase family 9 protein [Mariprofundaceae bacterium]|nr:glycosyltransferase family 9 protein [Mariprofundaceae bacterium]